MSHEEETARASDSRSDSDVLDASRASAVAFIESTGARPVELPEDYRLEGKFAGSAVDLDLCAFRGGRFAWARVTRMSSERVQVLNVVLVPSAKTALPCVGVEFLAFARGVHLVVVDAWPTLADAPSFADVLRSVRDDLTPRYDMEPRPEWGRQVFTEDVIFVRPGARAEAPVSDFTPALDALLEAIGDAGTPSPSDHQRHIENRRTWLTVQGEEEPAGDFLARIAGHDWVERFTFDVLYPTWLYDGDGQPPWAD